MQATQWEIDRARVLTIAEVEAILRDCRRRAKRSKITFRSLITFELATCCGLRCSEITGLRIGDVRLGLSPVVRVPAAIAKGSKPRTVPLHWEAGTLADIGRWVSLRLAGGARDADLLLPTRSGARMHRTACRRMFQRCVRKALGRNATTHDGRHTFVSLALAAGADIQAVRAAAGHANLATTSLYAHLVDRGTPVHLLGTV